MTEEQWEGAAAGGGARDRALADGEAVRHARRLVVSEGSPRIMVAFPFSKLEVREPVEEIGDLAAMAWKLAERVAVLARETVPEQAAATDAVAARAALLASRQGAAS